jgi:threonine dehydrogenase-like Zn-dependent dehydrogenase
MRGVTFPGDREIEFLEVSDPTPGEGEVVVEMKASGMCGSDLKFYRGQFSAEQLKFSDREGPVIAGHEPCGQIAAVGKGVNEREAKVGDRVMIYHYVGCGACEHCLVGWGHLCRQVPITVFGVSAHGGHAPYLKVPVSTVVPLPDEMSFVAGSAVSCGTGTAYSALRRLNASGRDTVAVFGQGPVGLSTTQLASAMGARVIAIDIQADRLARAKEFGADVTINAAETDPVAEIKEQTRGRGANITIEMAGSEDARRVAAQSTATWGTLCLVGEGGNLVLDVTLEMNRIQLNVIASWTFSKHIQRECADYVVERNIPVDKFFTHTWKLEDAVEAYRVFDQQTAGKGVFVF